MDEIVMLALVGICLVLIWALWTNRIGEKGCPDCGEYPFQRMHGWYHSAACPQRLLLGRHPDSDKE
jgi:hypothetical protein